MSMFSSIKFGFELEMFCGTDETENGVRIPSLDMPTDGFPGLVEFRTIGGMSLEAAWSKIAEQAVIYRFSDADLRLTQARFTTDQISAMRKQGRFRKPIVHVRNVYGKKQKDLKGLTLASFQINMSHQLSAECKDDKGVFHPARYGLLPCEPIVRELDKEFQVYIKSAKRQPGMYAIKDNIRLEYRSLPNSVFSFNPTEAYRLTKRIKEAVTRAVDGEHVY